MGIYKYKKLLLWVKYFNFNYIKHAKKGNLQFLRPPIKIIFPKSLKKNLILKLR